MIGTPNVFISPTDRGHTPEQMAEMCVNKIIYVSDDMPAEIREQAHEYRRRIKSTVQQYLHKAVQVERENMYSKLQRSGHAELAELLRGI